MMNILQKTLLYYKTDIMEINRAAAEKAYKKEYTLYVYSNYILFSSLLSAYKYVIPFSI